MRQQGSLYFITGTLLRSHVLLLSVYSRSRRVCFIFARAQFRPHAASRRHTGQAVRSCSWDDYKTDYTCNGLGYVRQRRRVGRLRQSFSSLASLPCHPPRPRGIICPLC